MSTAVGTEGAPSLAATSQGDVGDGHSSLGPVLDLDRLAGVVSAALRRDLGDEVDAIFRYGSRLTGAQHAYSDLDISYVPAHEGPSRSITVLVGQTLCDLYAIRWSEIERMARFESVSSTVLLQHQLVYARSPAVAERFQALADQLRALLRPEGRPSALRIAQALFQQSGYAYYLLCKEAARGHRWACQQHAQGILSTVLHCLAVCNQACIDTRKLPQVLALPKLPAGLAGAVERLTHAHTPAAVLDACETLLGTTRDLLLAEQRECLRGAATFPAAFEAGYPELKSTLQHVQLACERRDLFALRRPLVSLYHELSRCLAQATTGVRYTEFNSLSEYEQDLAALGFPALLPYVEREDFAGLRRQCLAFDQQLQRILTGHAVPLNTFATVDALELFLAVRRCGTCGDPDRS